jgi:hypothetical protein
MNAPKMRPRDAGLAYVDGAFRYFACYREIRRGRHKGWFELVVGGVKKRVEPKHIRRLPQSVVPA